MATWIAPKTDWTANTDDDGNYTGDHFDATDFNRIKNNLLYLYDIATSLYGSFDIINMGDNKTYSDFLYAEDFNAIEDNLNTINIKSVNEPIGTTRTYYANGYIFNYAELNRIESGCLAIYTKLMSQYMNRRKFKFRFGIKGGFLNGLD